MKEKIFSFFNSKRFNLPSVSEIKLAFKSMLKKEKVTLLILFLILFISVVGVWVEMQKKFTSVIPVEGGTLREGVTGTPYLVNPILATTDADRDLTMLIYAGLMKSDGEGGLEKELAQNYGISEDGLSYTFTLKDGLTWHDGEPLTSDDVAFSVNTAKNPTIKSPVRANWEGVEIEIIDAKNLRFLLKKPYAPFMENTTLGILPKHLWKNAAPEQFGLSDLNRQSVGAGPYQIQSIKRNSSGIITAYELKSFSKYALGKPLIPKIKMFFFNSESEMLASFAAGNINSLSSLTASNAKGAGQSAQLKTLILPRIFGVFFNQNKSEILRSQKVRQALDMAVDKEDLVRRVLSGFGTKLLGPLPPGVGDNEKATSAFDPEGAKNILDKEGWQPNAESGVREKKIKGGSIELAFSVSTANTPELIKTAELIKKMWEAIGVKIEIRLYEIGDLNQSVIRPRDYESLLFGQVVGRDPDPFAFWHSSQRNDPGLNIALYANKTVDSILESVRTANDIEKRKSKYEEFEKEVQKDTPAVFLFSPYYLYVAPANLKGIEAKMITIPAERFADAHKWHFYTSRVWKIFAN